MFCFIVKKRLVPYVEGALSPKAAEAVDKHISRCPKCAAELALIRGMCSTLRAAKTPAMQPATDLWQRIEQQIAVTPAPVRQKPLVRGLQYACAGAAVAVAVVAVRNLPTNDPVKVAKVIAERKPIKTVVARAVESKPADTYSSEATTSFTYANPKRKPQHEVFIDKSPAKPPVVHHHNDMVIASSDTDKPFGTRETRYLTVYRDDSLVDYYWNNRSKDVEVADGYSFDKLEAQKPADSIAMTDSATKSSMAEGYRSDAGFSVTASASEVKDVISAPSPSAAPKVMGDIYFANANPPELADRKRTPAEDKAKVASYTEFARRSVGMAWSSTPTAASPVPDGNIVLAATSPVLACSMAADLSPADDDTSVDIINDADDGTRLVALFSYP